MFNNCKLKKTFPNLWKKANLAPVHRKGEKYVIKIYHPVSLIPIFEKIVERLIFNSLFKYIDEMDCLTLTIQVFIDSILV